MLGCLLTCIASHGCFHGCIEEKHKSYLANMGYGHEPESAASLIELRLRAGECEISGGRTALVTSDSGTVLRNPRHGLFVYQTRVLGKYHCTGHRPSFARMAATTHA